VGLHCGYHEVEIVTVHIRRIFASKFGTRKA
jgi:hypothetical protein